MREVTPRATPKGTLPVSPLLANAALPLAFLSRPHLAAFAIAAAVVIAYCLLVLAAPTKRCRCQPGQERARCRRCKRTGRHYRPGAVAIHRFYWSVLGSRRLEKRREQLAALAERINPDKENTP
jgi:hypothetical protein